MKLSKSKPNLKHKKILSMNSKDLKKSTPRINEEDKKETIKDNQNQILENTQTINNNNNESELSNSTQLDWVKSAIQVKTKNNEIIKLSLENENFFEQGKIKVNKIQKFKDLDFINKEKEEEKEKEKEKEKNNENKINEDISKNNNTTNHNNHNLMNLNKIDNKESGGYMMISTKESEKNDNNFKYLSNKKNKNMEITFPENINDENNDEDMVNMKTVTIFNTNTELNNTNNLFNKNKIYRKRLKTGFLNYNKNSSKNSIRSKMFDNRNNNYLSNLKYNTTNNEKKGKIIIKNSKSNNKIFSIDLTNKNISHQNINIPNLNKHKNDYETINNIHDFDNSNLILNNSILNQTTKNNNITPYLNNRNNNIFPKKNAMFLNYSEFKSKHASIFSNYMNTEKTEINNIINHNILNDNNNANTNNTITQTYKYITPNKTLLKKENKNYPSSKYIKTNISQKYLLSSHNKSNILLRHFLTQIHLEKYFSILKLNGFDNINLLIEQMKTNVPIKDSELKKAGIKLPGDRAKILIRLEEKGNLFPYPVPKKVYYSLKNNNNYINIEKDENIIELKRWLKEFKLENYLDNFIKNGYHSVELFLFQMISKNPIGNDILKNEIGIEKIGHRSRILSILKEESRNMENKLGNKEPINFSDETKNCDCFIF